MPVTKIQKARIIKKGCLYNLNLYKSITSKITPRKDSKPIILKRPKNSVIKKQITTNEQAIKKNSH